MNVVTKATSRRRGVAKTVRAAQKTPLPGDAVTETIPDAPATPVDVSKLDKMSLGELRQLGHALGFSTALKEGKAALVRIIRENPSGPRAAKKAQPAADDVESKPSAKVDPKRAEEIGARMVELRKTYTRGLLATECDLTPSVIWRVEQGRIKPAELDAVLACFERIERGEITAPERKVFGQPQSGPTKTALKSTLDEVQHILSSAPVQGAKVAQLRTAINNALDAIERATKADE